MDTCKHIVPVAKMSKTWGVSRSGYYRWVGRPPSKRTLENEQFKKQIRQIWLSSAKTYGSPRINVALLMKQMGIQSQIRPKWVNTTDSGHRLPVAPNLLDRDFTADRLAQRWVSDITYLPPTEGGLYLTTVLDLADCQIIGWSLSRSMETTATTILAWEAACRRRPPQEGLIFHSDRGVQYACDDFTELLAAEKVTQSMSRKGNCWDNAPAESFFKTLKAELPVNLTTCNYRQSRGTIFSFIDIWYNRKRLHSSLDYRTPAQFEQLLTMNKQQAA